MKIPKFMRAKKAVDFNIPNTNKPSDDLLEYIKDDQYGIDLKIDGTRAVIDIDEEGNITIYGRGTVQKQLHSEERVQRVYNDQFPELAKIKIPELALTRLDSELIIKNPDTGKTDYNLLETRVSRKKDVQLYAAKYPACFQVFDIQKFKGEDLTNKSLFSRRIALHEASLQMMKIQKQIEIMSLGVDVDQKNKIVLQALESDAEGVMIKDLDAIYNDGSGEWFKAKRVHTEDVFVLGITEGTGKYKPYFGQLHCYQFDEYGKIHFICSVGGGFSFEQMAAIREYYGKDVYYPKIKDSRQMLNQYQMLKEMNKLLVIEIKHYGIVKSGRRHPNFIRIREKDAEECILSSSQPTDDQMSLEEFY